MKSQRNKTIDFPINEGEAYLERCAVLNGKAEIGDVTDKIILGDTFDIMPLLPERSVDLLIADPPYSLSRDYNGNPFKKSGDTEYRDFTRRWIEAALPLLKSTASVYICCDWESSLIIGGLLGDYFTVRNRITWQREKGRGAKANWKNSMEDIWFATVSDNYTFNIDAVKIRRKVMAPYRTDGKPKDWEETANGNFRDTCPSNFWDDISIPYWSMPENTAHPTQKPEKLIAKLILASSDGDSVVFDPFSGSGTTAVTAKKLGRRFICVEQNPLYCAWAQKRLETACTDTSIQGFSDGVFWERNTSSLQKKQKK